MLKLSSSWLSKKAGSVLVGYDNFKFVFFGNAAWAIDKPS